jgi:hypothetical protein
MNNWCICWFFMHIFTGDVNFKGLTARRLYTSFDVKRLKEDSQIPCRSPAMPFHEGFRLCLSHLVYTVRPCLIHTCNAVTLMPRMCRSESDLSRPRQVRGRGTALERHGMCELASAVQKRHVGDMPSFGSVGEWQRSGRSRQGNGTVYLNGP